MIRFRQIFVCKQDAFIRYFTLCCWETVKLPEQGQIKLTQTKILKSYFKITLHSDRWHTPLTFQNRLSSSDNVLSTTHTANPLPKSQRLVSRSALEHSRHAKPRYWIPDCWSTPLVLCQLAASPDKRVSHLQHLHLVFFLWNLAELVLDQGFTMFICCNCS